MKPGYNTNGLSCHRLDEALVMIAKAGFKAVALALDVPHLDPLRVGAGEIEKVARQLRDLQLEVVVETGGRYLLDPGRKHRPNLLEVDPAARARRRDLLIRSIDISRDLGARTVSLWAGVVPAETTVTEAWSRFREELTGLLEHAATAGIRLALEPEPGHLVERVAHWRQLAGELSHPAFGLCLDIGHLLAVNEDPLNQVITKEDIPRIFQVHLEDSNPGVHLHLEPGEGQVDFPATLGFFREMGYQGPICWELSRSSYRAPQALAAAKAVF